MTKTTRRWVWCVVVASGGLTGCVGYDGGSDGASAQAQSLGITEQEETRIRDALSQEAVSGEELVAIEEAEQRLSSIDALAGDPRALAIRRDGAARFTQADGEACLGDINCTSGHCDVSGVCAAIWEFFPPGVSCEENWECQSNRCDGGRCARDGAWRAPGASCSSDSHCKYGCSGAANRQGVCKQNNGNVGFLPPGSPCSSATQCQFGCYATSKDKRCANSSGRSFLAPDEMCRADSDCEFGCTYPNFPPMSSCKRAPDAGAPDASIASGGRPDASWFDGGPPDASVPEAGAADASVAGPSAPPAIRSPLDFLDDGRNGRKDGSETDIDCGGDSYYACPLNAKCKDDDDCVAGTCDGVRGSNPGTCNLTSAAETDLAKFFPARPFSWSAFDPSRKSELFAAMMPSSSVSNHWPWRADAGMASPDELDAEVRDAGVSVLRDYAPMYGSVRLVPRDRAVSAQLAYVAQRPKSRGPKQNSGAAPELDAEKTRVFQHNTCSAHLLANGCSPVSWQARNHKVSYDYVLCPRANRATIGIAQQSENSSSPVYKRERERAKATLRDDPFLCNQKYTRAVRFLTMSNDATERGKSDLGTTATPRYASGYALSQRGYSIPQSAASKRFANIKDIDRLLLIGAACNRGRVVLVDGEGRDGVQREVPTHQGHPRLPKSLSDLCTRFTDTQNALAPGESSFSWFFLQEPGFRPDAMREIEGSEVTSFIRENVPYWADHDIYAIDPEGNPYLPSNMNMQFNWDVNYGAYNFGLYVQSWSAVGTAPLTKDNGVWGTRGANGTFSAFNYGL